MRLWVLFFFNLFCGQTVEKQLGAAENSFAVSGLEMGARYIVTVIAYRGNKRSKVVETIFKTGLCAQLHSLVSSLTTWVISFFFFLSYVILYCNMILHPEYCC